MVDKLILKIAEETASLLNEVPPHTHTGAMTKCEAIVPSYNALLVAAQENHPADKFLMGLKPIEPVDSCTKYELQILFTQLRIVLEVFAPGSAAQ